MKLLLLNSLKGLKKKKVQMLGIIIMVLLSTGIYTCMNTAIDRLEDRYYTYLDDQNVENISLDVLLDYDKDFSPTDIAEILNSQPELTDEERSIVTHYQQYLATPRTSPDFDLLSKVEYIFQKYQIQMQQKAKKLDTIKEKYNFYYEIQSTKTLADGKVMIAVLPYSAEQTINKAYLIEGRLPESSNEITMLPGFAKKNGIALNDDYMIAGKNYKVVGFTYAPDYIYPLISFSMPIFDEQNNNVIYMSKENYQSLPGVEETNFAIRFLGAVPRKFELTMSDDNLNIQTKMLKEESDLLTMSASTATRLGRIAALQLEFASNRMFADYFLYLLLAVSVIIIVIITKKRIDDERLQIGVLKSLGYNRFSIAASYLVYPIVGSLIGGMLGYLLGIAFHFPVSQIYLSFYTVPLSNFAINWNYLKTSILVPMVVLSLLSYVIAFWMLRKKPLQLLKEGSNLKVNLFSRLVNKITSIFPFYSRFKYALASRSLGKLFIVTITSFCTGLLIVLVLIGSNLFHSLIETSFSGMKYDYMVALNTVLTEEKEEQSDFILAAQADLIKIVSKNGREKSIGEDPQFSFTGLDLDSKYTDILDQKEKSMKNLLAEESSMIINQNVKEIFGIEIGDTLTFSFNGKEITYQVVGVCEEYMGNGVYVNRTDLSQKLGFPKAAYNEIVSVDPKYSDSAALKEESGTIAMVISMPELKANIMKQMDRFNGSVYIVIFFASFMAFVIIAVIANIVVEENKKTISLMKVMGYKNKKISQVVLNIYTPFIILAYLLSIPIMVQILKAIVKALIGDTNMVIPVSLSPWLALLGLLGLLVAYYIAIAISKRILNKVPLSVALKRE